MNQNRRTKFYIQGLTNLTVIFRISPPYTTLLGVDNLLEVGKKNLKYKHVRIVQIPFINIF